MSQLAGGLSLANFVLNEYQLDVFLRIYSYNDTCTSEDTSSSGYEGLDQSSEGWLADCLNDSEAHFNSDDVYVSLDF